MGREIKFKIWLPGIKKMSYEHTLEELMNWGTKEWTNGTAIFLQYTGLKDKNGKEAYHKDIVEHEGIKYVIEWCEIDTGFYLAHHACREDLDSEYHLLGKCIRECEIIGSIYENPELLEV